MAAPARRACWAARRAASTPSSVTQGGKTYRPPHLSKDQDIEIGVGDVVRVQTPGGGGFGDPAKRKPELIARDIARGYYTRSRRRSSAARQTDDRRPSLGARSHSKWAASAASERCTRLWSGASPMQTTVGRCRCALAGARRSRSSMSRREMVRRAGRGQCLHRRDAGRCRIIGHQRRLRARHGLRAAFLQPRMPAAIPSWRRPRSIRPMSMSASRAASCRRRSTSAPSGSPAASGPAPTGARSAAAPAVESTGLLQGGNVLRQLVATEGPALRVARLPGARRASTAPEADRFFQSLKLKA